MQNRYPIENAQDAQSIINLLEENIYAFNSSRISKHDGALFARIVHDGNGVLVGGIAGWTWAHACEITVLWVAEELRHKGIGKRLLKAAEEEAKNRKCNVIVIRSYSFQAPLFYERNGYKVEYVINNFPPGYDYFILKKSL